ncbi:hypothetical protein [Endozoicomonas sp. Mp262]|uniref:hypothetical protein n=1 Tax=Endozoicomonas sp. Mp262 TaxID=2919499 RepID=UPI0021D86BE4
MSIFARKPRREKSERVNEAIADLQREPVKRLNINLPRSVHKSLKQLALENNETLHDLINRLIHKELKRASKAQSD